MTRASQLMQLSRALLARGLKSDADYLDHLACRHALDDIDERVADAFIDAAIALCRYHDQATGKTLETML